MSLLDRQIVACTHCGHAKSVMPNEIAYTKAAECDACGKFFDIPVADLIEVILLWLAGLP